MAPADAWFSSAREIKLNFMTYMMLIICNYFNTFALMKRKSFITVLISGVVLLVFLAASTGIAVVKHYCHHCGDGTVAIGIVAESEAHSHSCCSESGCHSEGQNTEADNEDCCRIEMNLLKVTNYFPEMPRTINPEFILIPVIYQNTAPSLPEKSVFAAFAGQERYGGRSIVTSHRQLLI